MLSGICATERDRWLKNRSKLLLTTYSGKTLIWALTAESGYTPDAPSKGAFCGMILVDEMLPNALRDPTLTCQALPCTTSASNAILAK
jgi:hypothetical protein